MLLDTQEAIQFVPLAVQLVGGGRFFEDIDPTGATTTTNLARGLDIALRGVDILAVRLRFDLAIAQGIDPWPTSSNLTVGVALYTDELDAAGAPFQLPFLWLPTFPVQTTAVTDEQSVYPQRVHWRDSVLLTTAASTAGVPIKYPTGQASVSCNRRLRARISERQGLFAYVFPIQAIVPSVDSLHQVTFALNGQFWYRARF